MPKPKQIKSPFIGRTTPDIFMNVDLVADVEPCSKVCPCSQLDLVLDDRAYPHGHLQLMQPFEISETFPFPLQSLAALRFVLEACHAASRPSVKWWSENLYLDLIQRLSEFTGSTLILVDTITAFEQRLFENPSLVTRLITPKTEAIVLGR